jgi:hypothetical protein
VEALVKLLDEADGKTLTERRIAAPRQRTAGYA